MSLGTPTGTFPSVWLCVRVCMCYTAHLKPLPLKAQSETELEVFSRSDVLSATVGPVADFLTLFACFSL